MMCILLEHLPLGFVLTWMAPGVIICNDNDFSLFLLLYCLRSSEWDQKPNPCSLWSGQREKRVISIGFYHYSLVWHDGTTLMWFCGRTAAFSFTRHHIWISTHRKIFWVSWHPEHETQQTRKCLVMTRRGDQMDFISAWMWLHPFLSSYKKSLILAVVCFQNS